MGEDNDGNTPLHNAVKSGDLKAVRQLLREKTVDVSSENNECKNPLDIARERQEQDIIDELVKKIIHDSLDALKISFKEKESDKIPSDKVLTRAEREIKLTEEKIKYCLKSLKQLNADNRGVKKPRHKEAEIWINFIKEFASNGCSNVTIKDKIGKYFERKDGSGIPTEEARLANVRELIKSYCEESIADDGNAEKLSYEQLYVFIDCMEVFASEGFGIEKIEDMIKDYYSQRYVGEYENLNRFIADNIHSFFTELQNYVQHSYKRANVLVYFVEALALEGSGNTDIKTEMKQHFSKCYTEQHRELISDTRILLLKERSPQSQHPATELGLEDIDKFTNGDAESFFVKLEEYLQYVQDVLKLNIFLKNVEQKNFKERVKGFDPTGKLTREVLSNFIDFHPELQNQTEEHFTDFMKNSFFTELRKYIQNGQYIEKIISFIKELALDERNEEKLKSKDTSFLEKEVTTFIQKSDMRLKIGQKQLVNSLLEYCDVCQKRDDSPVLVFRILQESEEFEPENNFVLKPLKGSERKLGKKINGDKDFLKREFEKLIKIAYRPKDITPQLLFSFIVNFYREFDAESRGQFKRLRNLRNIFMHQFHKYGCAEFGPEISKLRHELFIYYYAKQVHAKLRDIEGGERPETIDEYLREELDNLNKSFKTDDEIKMDIPMSSDEERGFKAHKFSKSLFPEKYTDVQGLVNQYFKFLIFIDSKKREDENPIDEEEDPSSPFSDLERREISEEFDKLDRIIKRDGNEDHPVSQYSEDEKIKFKTFVTNRGVREDRFDKVWNLYRENRSESSQTNDGDIIAGIINALKRFKIDYGLSNRGVISLYDQFAKKRGIFGPGEDHGLSRNKLIMDNIQSIANELSVHSPDEDILLFIDGEAFYIRRREVVSNILNTFYNAFHTYRIEFNIEDIFDDEIFLESLVKRPTNIPDYMVIKKLLKLDYTAPYIVRLITKAKSDKRIEEADLKELVEKLLTREDGLYIKHLNELLKIRSEKFDLYEEVCRTIRERGFNIESMRCILKEFEHVKKFLDILNIGNGDRLFAEKPFRDKLLKLLNDVVLELIYDCNYQKALEILNAEAKVISTYEKLNDVIVVEYKLNMAKVKNALGKADGKVTAKKTFSEALKVLEEIPSNTESPQFLLALSRKAYTQSLLKEYGRSVEENHTLYEKMVEYVLDPSLDAITILNTWTNEEIYDKIHESPKYQELIALSEEYRMYLSIGSIRRSMAWGIIKDGDVTRSRRYRQHETALGIYEGIYKFERKHFGRNVRTMVQSTCNFALAHVMLGTASSNQQEYSNALRHFQDALVRNFKVLGIRRKIYDSHAAIEKTLQHMIRGLRNITSANEKIAKLSDHTEKAMLHYKEALLIHTRIYEFQEHKYITDSIVLMTDELRSSEPSTEESRYFKKVLNVYEEAFRVEKNKEGKAYLHTLRDIIKSIASIPNKLGELKVSYSVMAKLLFHNEELKFALTTLNDLAMVRRKLTSVSKSMGKAEILEHWKKIIKINITLYKYNEYEYIFSSILSITKEFRNPTILNNEEKESLRQALDIYEKALQFVKSKQHENNEYTLMDEISSIAFIGNNLELELSNDWKDKLLSRNESLQHTLNNLRQIAGANRKLGDSKVNNETGATQNYEIAFEIFRVLYKFNEFIYILNSITFMTDKLRDSNLPREESRLYEEALSIYEEASNLKKRNEEGGDEYNLKDLIKSIVFIDNQLKSISPNDQNLELLPHDEAVGWMMKNMKGMASTYELFHCEDYRVQNRHTREKYSLTFINRFHKKSPKQQV